MAHYSLNHDASPVEASGAYGPAITPHNGKSTDFIRGLPETHTTPHAKESQASSPSQEISPVESTTATSTSTTLTPSASLTISSSFPTPTSSETSNGKNKNRIFPPKQVLIRDLILGFADGLTVPFALCAGLSSLQNSRVVVIAGLAELFSGAISMGLGCYLAAVTEGKVYDVRKGEVCEMWEKRRGDGGGCEKGVVGGSGDDDDELYGMFEEYGVGRSEASGVVTVLQGKKDAWAKFMLSVSLKIEEPALRGAWVEGLVMGISYFIGGLLPMLPYFCTSSTLHALIVSIALTATILLIFGYTKSYISTAPVSAKDTNSNDNPKSSNHPSPVSNNSPNNSNEEQMRNQHKRRKDALISALHTLITGIVAAGTSYGIVRAVESSTHSGTGSGSSAI
ncbi:hypothetical protein AAFC00_003117 [Neodothiora populina]|uniref:Uncharacterized protein n=1 Tax=Neodothiora populina TaxID=2781224 RepID=A0ABR3PAK5_9PEZI